MMPHPKQSIAVLRYPEGKGGHATGFFVDTQNHGQVCVTAAHVFWRDRHPGETDEARKRILVNGKLARVVFDAFDEYGMDVALVSLPDELNRASLVFHTPGVTQSDASAFYAHAWSAPKADPSTLTFTKIWGIRFGPEEILDAEANPLKAQTLKRWLLRSDVAKRPTQFEPAVFQPGWSGAPVFNVRPTVAEHRVIGVLTKTLGDREAAAVSVESLEFLEPREHQAGEIMPPPLNPRLLQMLERGRADAPATSADVAALRFEEILEIPTCPKISEPESPYDDRPVQR